MESIFLSVLLLVVIVVVAIWLIRQIPVPAKYADLGDPLKAVAIAVVVIIALFRLFRYL